MKDTVYAEPQKHLVDFTFDESVASVFPDMIRRSVPGYEVVVPMTGLLAARALDEGDHAYDLGCSLGASTLAVLSQLGKRNVRITSVDNAPAMLEQAKRNLDDARVHFLEDDVRTMTFEPAKVVLSNWLLQFVPPDERQQLIERIAEAITPGGCLLLSEKVCFEDPTQQSFCEDTHHAFKRANGYSDLEVSQKRSAIENVMIPDTIETHMSRLKSAGFSSVQPWFTCLNWVSMVAWR